MSFDISHLWKAVAMQCTGGVLLPSRNGMEYEDFVHQCIVFQLNCVLCQRLIFAVPVHACFRTMGKGHMADCLAQHMVCSSLRGHRGMVVVWAFDGVLTRPQPNAFCA
ncbi:unnamed protein product [Ostreobium quekettii]|uniref:Uncharacterized protein n=1 Tax=Ostreobium quekettii TaxID=121088 RepID=A0A8S1IWS6_9CHLO|nr:unnamed protein product [Ostreobium quekettii]